MARLNIVGSVIGRRGTGKSLFILGSKYASKDADRQLGIPGIVDASINKGKKVLFIDTLDHPTYRSIPLLSQKEFTSFKTGVRRTFHEPDNIIKLVDQINKAANYNNSTIVFEDAGKYCGAKLPKPFTRLVADSKQRNIDIIFMFHCFIDTPGDIFTKSDFIQLFKTHDNPDARKGKIAHLEKVWHTYREVQASKNPFYGQYIDIRTS